MELRSISIVSARWVRRAGSSLTILRCSKDTCLQDIAGQVEHQFKRRHHGVHGHEERCKMLFNFRGTCVNDGPSIAI